MDLEGINANDTKEGQIFIGEEGTKIAKNISSRIEAAVENGNFSLNVSGTVFVTNKNSMNISEPKPFCTKGQTFRDGYCRKYCSVSIHIEFARGFVSKDSAIYAMTLKPFLELSCRK